MKKKSIARYINICLKKRIAVEKHLRDKCTFVFIFLFERLSNLFQVPTKCVMYLYYSEFSRFILCVCLAC